MTGTPTCYLLDWIRRGTSVACEPRLQCAFSTSWLSGCLSTPTSLWLWVLTASHGLRRLLLKFFPMLNSAQISSFFLSRKHPIPVRRLTVPSLLSFLNKGLQFFKNLFCLNVCLGIMCTSNASQGQRKILDPRSGVIDDRELESGALQEQQEPSPAPPS